MSFLKWICDKEILDEKLNNIKDLFINILNKNNYKKIDKDFLIIFINL